VSILHSAAASAVALGLLCAPPAQAQQPWSGLPADLQIRLAVQAAPAQLQASATVQGWNEEGEFVVLREGSGELICMAPNPDREDFEVSCHHRDLEGFFKMGRDLRAQGVEGMERLQARWAAYERGEIEIPTGSVNHILTGSGFDPGTGEVTDPYLRSTIYTPGATPESTGIGIEPAGDAPWLMFPGTPGSHIMITPPRGG